MLHTVELQSREITWFYIYIYIYIYIYSFVSCLGSVQRRDDNERGYTRLMLKKIA